MAEISNTVANNNLRASVAEQIIEWARDHFDSDCRMVANNEFTMPAINANGEELYVNITVTIPKGERDTANHCYFPYDGYAAAEAYEFKKQEEANKAKAKAEAAALKKKRGRKPKEDSKKEK